MLLKLDFCALEKPLCTGLQGSKVNTDRLDNSSNTRSEISDYWIRGKNWLAIFWFTWRLKDTFFLTSALNGKRN